MGKALTSFDDVASYVGKNGKLPDNFITKDQAKALGWDPKKGIFMKWHLAKVLVEISSKIRVIHYQTPKEEFGTKQTLTTLQDIVETRDYFTQMTV
jgi:hypothetical protein